MVPGNSSQAPACVSTGGPRRNLRAGALSLVLALAGALTAPAASEPLRLAVADPLAREHACACVAGYAQRDYGALARYLTRRLRCPVVCEFPAAAALAGPGTPPDLVIGQRSLVEAAFAATGQPLRLLALLTGPDGQTSQPGLFLVRQADPAHCLLDLRDRRILFGPPAAADTYGAALAALRLIGLPPPEPPTTRDTGGAAVSEVLRGEADAALVSRYALPLLIGCGAVGNDDLRVVGHTAAVPFIALLATARFPRALCVPIVNALAEAGADPELRRCLETRDGFVVLPSLRPADAAWPDWRGSDRRDGLSAAVPEHLPATARFAWRRGLCGQGLGGLAANPRRVIVSDKSEALTEDVWRCLDAGTGEPLWTVSYPVPAKMDFTSAPRATAVIATEAVYLLSAFGDLLCVDLADGRTRWRLNLIARFGGDLPTWGFCGTPLLVGDSLVVQTAAAKVGLVALNRHSGKLVWRSPGPLPAYGSLLAGEFGGRRQIVGHDATSLGGWDADTGQRLWRVLPPAAGDFNVPTPVAVGDLLLVATENNGARLFSFHEGGTPRAAPVAHNADFAPDTVSPVLVDGRLWGFAAGRLRCLEVGSGLGQVWEWDGQEAGGHVSLIGGNGRVLVVTHSGELWLFPARPAAGTQPERLRVFTAEEGFSPEVWSHPALVGKRLYLRSRNEIVCLGLE